MKPGAGIGPLPHARRAFPKHTVPRLESGFFLRLGKAPGKSGVSKRDLDHKSVTARVDTAPPVLRITKHVSKPVCSEFAVQESAWLAQSCQGGWWCCTPPPCSAKRLGSDAGAFFIAPLSAKANPACQCAAQIAEDECSAA